jgi:hypothetical protein
LWWWRMYGRQFVNLGVASLIAAGVALLGLVVLKGLLPAVSSSVLFIRSPKLTVLCRGTKRVWFLLLSELGSGLRGQFHRSLTTTASAPHSTGVFTLRRTAGELA